MGCVCKREVWCGWWGKRVAGEGGSVCVGGEWEGGREGWWKGGGACQLGLGVRVASQFPNQVDKGVVVLPGEKELCDFCCKGCPSESGQTLVVGWWVVGRCVCVCASRRCGAGGVGRGLQVKGEVCVGVGGVGGMGGMGGMGGDGWNGGGGRGGVLVNLD